jgi:c-di-GMP phosphodiesterase
MSDAIVARQPIFDDRQKLVGFELLYRRTVEATSAGGVSPAVMASSTVVQAVLGIGLERLAEGERVWINCTRDLLVDRSWDLLDPKRVVLEVLETVEPDEEVIAACSEARRRGYQLALDDFVFTDAWVPLLKLCQIVKVDVMGRSPQELRPIVAQLKPYSVKLLAERVETDAMRATCAQLGFTLFQGYFYCQPETVVRRDLSAAETSSLQLLNLVRKETAGSAEIEVAIKRDPGLTFKLLRIVNSASMGFSGIESISHALRLIGRTALERWLTLLVMASFSRNSARQREQFKLSLTRARLLESMSPDAERGQRFLVGMFSLLHVLLQCSMQEVVVKLQLSEAVQRALLHRDGAHGALLAAVEAYEVGDWAAVERLGGGDDRLLTTIAAHYPAALQWAIDQVASTE